MNLHLEKSSVASNNDVAISGSKSETNRLLLLKALFPTIQLKNISDSDDSKFMMHALATDDGVIDIGHAGTAMRFLTAYFAICDGRTVTLTGWPRMKERPIKVLVDALSDLGADIQYLENEGFPPIKIIGRKITKNLVTLKANVSSQYISALLLVAPKLENGLELKLEGDITSIPYIHMTLALLNKIGITTTFEGNKIVVSPKLSIITRGVAELSEANYQFLIESDWSSASYFYSIIALSQPGFTLTLSSFKKNSFQGDNAVAAIYKDFGVDTAYEGNYIKLTKNNCQPLTVNRQLNNNPDLAQTIAVTCLGLGLGCILNGLHTLKIKETDRLQALKNELGKLGAKVSITDDSLKIEPCEEINKGIFINTYHDHRMAMAFAPLALRVPIIIENADVVSKSYPAFWKDLQKIGFQF